MNKIVIGCVTVLLGYAVSASLQAAEHDHAGHGHEHAGEQVKSGKQQHGHEKEGHKEHDHKKEEHKEHDHDKEGHKGQGHRDEGHEKHGHHEERHEEHVESDVNLTPEQRQAVGVVSKVLMPRAISADVRAPGEVQLNAYATTRIAPRIAAQVIERHARLGDHLRQGQALVTLSSVDMAQAQGDLLVAEREWQRVRKLGQKVVSEQRYTQVRVAREQARAKVRAYGMTKAEIKRLLTTGNAEMADGRFQLLATQGGTVIRDDFIVGELVEPGRVLFEITDESVLWVEARLTPEQAGQVDVDASATVTVNKHEVVEGRVIQVHHALDESTRTLGVRIEIPNPDDRFHPGLFVEVRIDGSVAEKAMAVPDEAVMRSPDGDWVVFVEARANVFEPREVAVSRTSGGDTVIEGLEPGARVVTQGAFFLQSELAKAGFEVHQH